MSGIGGEIWMIGLVIGLGVLAVGYIVATTRRRKPGVTANPNNAWEQAAAESGHPEVARRKSGSPS